MQNRINNIPHRCSAQHQAQGLTAARAQVDAGATRSSKQEADPAAAAENSFSERRLGAAAMQVAAGWQSRINDAARARAHVFYDAPGGWGRKGLVGGLCVAAVAVVGFVALFRGADAGGRGSAAAKRAARRK